MEVVTIAVRVADKLQQFNGQTYFLMDSSAVEYIDKDGNTKSVKQALDNGIDELTKEDVERLLGLTKEEIEAMTDLILDTEVRIDKTYSSSKIYTDIQQCLEDSKTYTLEELGKKIGASYKVVSSTDDMVSQNYLYLLNNGNDYDIYIVDVDNIPIVIGDTTIDLSNYATKTELDEKVDSSEIKEITKQDILDKLGATDVNVGGSEQITTLAKSDLTLPTVLESSLTEAIINYVVVKGMANVSISFLINSTSSALDTWNTIRQGLPKPYFGLTEVCCPLGGSTTARVTFNIGVDGNLIIRIPEQINATNRWYCNFCYPVKEL